jgi:hypothetical protein
MPCDKCRELYVRFAITYPGELRKAIRIASQNCADGTLVERVFAPQLGNGASFMEIAAGGNWGDFVDFRFECTSCGEKYRLLAETYHGSGGCWEPEGADASPEQL